MWQRMRKASQPKPGTLWFTKALVCVLHIAQIAVGAVYLQDCPRQHYIPIYLVVMGVLGMLLGLFACLPCAKEPEEGTASPLNRFCTSWNYLGSLFMFCWFITGNVWVYSIHEPNYNQTLTDVNPYCDKTVYLFAFWTITLVYILIGLFLFTGCCVMVCFYICGRADPDDNV